jgi:anti-sigma factor RsiW
MINHDSQLKLQAYLDGELSAREATEVKDWLAKDQDGQALLTELKNTSAALAGNEMELKLSESREFYWSKIQREIERQQKETPVRTVSLMTWLRHHLASVGGAAVLTCLMAVMLLHGAGPSQFAEMEVASDDMGAYTFRNQQDKMTMVWFYDRNDDSTDAAEPATIASMDPE